MFRKPRPYYARARAATNADNAAKYKGPMMEWCYRDEYTFRVVERFEEPLFTNLLERIFFTEFSSVNFGQLMDPSEKARENELKQNLKDKFSLRIAVYHRDAFVGWTFGYQDTDNQFYMSNSAVLPEHRNQGIYKELLSGILRITKEHGFQSVYSKHLAANNAIIIPKLKAGFVITGMEMLEWAGLMVRMTFYHHRKRRQLYDFRVGMAGPTSDIKTALGI